MLSIKRAVAEGDSGGCGNRLGGWVWISAVYPSFAFVFLHVFQTRWEPSTPYSLIPTECALRQF